jgi:Chaperone of endosialidase
MRFFTILLFLALQISLDAQNMGVKLPVSTSPNTTLDVNGSSALREGTAMALSNGVNTNIVLGDFSFFRITGPTAGFSITGFMGGQNGRVLHLINATSQILTFTHQATSIAGNQINTGGANLNLAANGVANLMYNTSLSKWVVTGGQGFITDWSLVGNGNTTAGTNFIGTTNAQDLVFKTNDTEKLRIQSSGNIGVGHNSPDANLHLYGVGQSGFTPTSHGLTAVHGAEIAFSANGFSNPAASIQLLDYNAYSSGLCFNVHKGTSNGGTGIFADNWPTDVIQAMTIDNRGYVGIGTGSPGAALHVSSNNAGLYNDILLSGYNNADIPVFNIRRARGTDVAPVNLVNGDGLGGNHYYGYVGGGWSYLSGVYGNYEGNGTNSLSSLSFMSSNSLRMVLDENGNLGINTTTPTAGFKLSVNGTAEKTGSTSWAIFSDSRIKRNVRQFTEGLATLEKINPVWFQYNNKSGYEDTTKTYVGVIAQEVEKVAPYMVEKTKTANFDDQRVYDSNALNYILVNSVKELSDENKKLKAENAALKAAVEKNSHDIESIKAMLDKKQH